MELADGETLAERLRRGLIPVEDALPIFKQIAEALEAAHEKGIIHRDLKPANIKVSTEGKVKVLDFGLAKAMSGDPVKSDVSESPTITRDATATGVILGTAAYMSPEQARGKVVDKRADIWAFGCMFFEALTAKPAFAGRDVAEILAAVIRAEPDLDRLPPGTPLALRRLIARCLEKDPWKRLRDIGDARNELDDTRARPLTEPAPERATAGGRLRTTLPWAMVVLLGASTLGLLLRQQSSEKSPTGTHIAYNGRVFNQVDVYVRALASLGAEPLADAREAWSLFFSPDGEWVGILTDRELQKVSIHGGRPQTVTSFSELRVEVGGSWGPDGDILLGTFSGLYRVSSTGGDPEPVTRLDTERGELGHLSPSHLPGGKKALISIWRAEEDPQIAVVDLASGNQHVLPVFGDGAIYSPTGHILYRQDSSVIAAPFDVDRLTVSGDPIPVLEGVHHGPQFSVSSQSELSRMLGWSGSIEAAGRHRLPASA
jgi:serine/threonine-protein kinase